MQSCAIDLRQRLFRCSHYEKIFVSETREKQSQKYLVTESWGATMNISYDVPRSSKGQFFFEVSGFSLF